MSVPADLRALCHLLSTTETPHLPSITPTLQRLALGCGSILSTQDGSSMKSDTNESSVLVHKLKTQISVLLNGRIPEGRFAAVVLIQAVVDVGGWEVLRSSESWVRGLLSLLNVCILFIYILIYNKNLIFCLETTRSSCYQETLYLDSHHHLYVHPSVSDVNTRNNNTHLANFCDVLSECDCAEISSFDQDY